MGVDAAPKREFRAAWIQAVNGQFMNLGRDAMQSTLTQQLDVLQSYGTNVIIFQVRPECDALYESPLEPWSRFLTGQQGLAPNPYWDPLQWMIEQCHKRGMELHAWINPYRAKTKTTTAVSPDHVAAKHPDWIFEYGGMYLLNPALKQSRDFICDVVEDILLRYDVDGLHIDDYFYPYPEAGIQIPDGYFFQQNPGSFTDIGDWRRNNVDLFIEQLSKTIHKTKPWVKFGVSPFGIYRNERNAPGVGSKTNGLQNYDELYADVLKWVKKGWIDYNVPQLYWQIGNVAADYKELIRWWDKNAAERPLFIGEDVERTVKYADTQNPSVSHQLDEKMRLHNECKNVGGTVLWYAKAAVDNVGNYGTMLKQKYWNTPALQPRMPWIDGKAPKKPKKLQRLNINGKNILFWTAPKGKGWKDQAVRYCVYAFARGEKVNLNDASHLVKITTDEFFEIPASLSSHKLYVTALDRMSNESKAAKK